MSSPAIATYGLTKRYGDLVAVDRLDLRVSPGSIYAFLGLNGAGKSTTIRMLLGMIKPTDGHVEIFGERVSPGRAGIWSQVGHLVEFATAYPELSVRENLEIARRFHGVRDRAAVGRTIERLGLVRYANRPAGKLSLGNLQRLALARAVLHDPRLLILDEPANGLDPAGVVEIRELLRTLAHEYGVTVFMSSHVLGEVARLATRVGIIHLGRLVEELDSSELHDRLERRLEVRSRDICAAETVLRNEGFAPVRTSESDDSLLILREERALDEPDEVARLLSLGGTPPTHLAVNKSDLEEHFIGLTQRAERNSR